MADLPDLSRYADWLAGSPRGPLSDPDVRCAWVGGSAATGGYDEWSDLDVDVLCTPGTSTAVYTRWLARRGRTSTSRDVWEVPEHVWPDGRQCFVNLQDRPGLLLEPTRLIDLHVSRPVGPALAPRHTPARHTDRAARPGRAGRPRGGGRPRGAGGRGRSQVAPAPGDRTSGWSTARSPAGTSPRPSTSTCASRWRRWSGWSGPSTARRATTSGCATCARTCPPTSRTGSSRWCRAPASPRSRSCPCVASRGSTSSWPLAQRSAPALVLTADARVARRGAAAPRTRGSARRTRRTASASPRRTAPARPGPRRAGPEPRGETGAGPRSSSGRARRRAGRAGATAAYRLHPAGRGRAAPARPGSWRPDLLEPLGVLVGGQAALGEVLAQVRRRLLALGVADPQAGRS